MRPYVPGPLRGHGTTRSEPTPGGSSALNVDEKPSGGEAERRLAFLTARAPTRLVGAPLPLSGLPQAVLDRLYLPAFELAAETGEEFLRKLRLREAIEPTDQSHDQEEALSPVAALRGTVPVWVRDAPVDAASQEDPKRLFEA